MFKKYITLILFVSVLFVSTDGAAQLPGGCSDDPADGLPPCPPSTPIGGGTGVVILVAAGVALGIKKLRD